MSKSDILTPEQPPATRREIKGRVVFSDKFPAAGLVVKAFKQQLRGEQELGTSRTDNDGVYQIQYAPDQPQSRQTRGAALVVRVLGADGSVLVESSLFDAPAVATVDLTIPADKQTPPSLFEKIAQTLVPVLDGVKLEQLDQKRDLSFLSRQTGMDQASLARYVSAHKLSRNGLPPEFWFAVSTDQWSSLDAAAVRKLLARAFNENLIPKTFSDKTAEWIRIFLDLAARSVISDAANPLVKSALDHAGIKETKKQQRFARLINEHQLITPELFVALGNDRAFSKEEVSDLQTSFQLADLTQADFSVVKAIKEEFGVRRPEDIRALARRSEAEWIAFVKDKPAAGAIKFPIAIDEASDLGKLPEAEIVGKTLARQFREAFPTTAFAGSLERALQNGGSRGLKHAETMSRFLDQHPDFDLLHSSVEDFLKQDQPGLKKVARDEAFKQEIKATQRVFKLARTFEATDALLADNLHSAQGIYRLGQSQFVQRYGNNDDAGATAIWNRAADTHAAALTIVADLKALDPNALPQALQTVGSQALASFPNWENLFQTGDLCDCKECRSVLSPAAYFADLLMYLKDRRAVNPLLSVKDILFARRPDLGYLELNCENALTMLPYIDVVCEVLESAIATDDNDVELFGLTNIPDTSATTITAITTALHTAGLDFGAECSLSQVDPSHPDRWVVHGDRCTYLLKKKITANFFAQVLPNIKAKADELRAYPQYVNPKAYEKLRQTRYPHTLPFDLFAEEVRAAMQKSNLQRWDLMMTFRGTAPNNPSDGDVAAEYFGISSDPSAAVDEKILILVQPLPLDQQAIWGETLNANWLDASGNFSASLCIVKNFLQKTGLEYNDLLALLDLEFINQQGVITIRHLDETCDTARKVIDGLDEPKLDLIHRFLRLWRKLKGWKLWELDLVIRHPRIGNGVLDQAFLIKLFYFSRLRERLGKKAGVEEVCALFGNLNTTTRFTKLHETRDDALYQQLFLNRKLINPLDPAFQLDPNTGDLIPGQTITGHRPVVVAALSLQDAELATFQNLEKASAVQKYLPNDDLNLTNLSFLWRHSWLAKQLKLKSEDWRLALKLYQQDIEFFLDPRAAWDLVVQLDHIRNSGFALDELNWLLAADRAAKSALKETDASRFLSALRKELQKIHTENDPSQHAFLISPTNKDETQLTALLTTLFQKLNRTDDEIKYFLGVLRGRVELEASAKNLPSTFTSFPPGITGAPNHIPIDYDATNQRLRFTGLMTKAQRTTLLTDSTLTTVTGDLNYQNAIADLVQLSASAATAYVNTEINISLPGGLVLPANLPSLPIKYNSLTQTLTFIGVMTPAEQNALIAAGNPSGVIDEIFNSTRTPIKFFEPIFIAPLAALPQALDFKTQLSAELSAKISYDAEQRLLRFTGIMSIGEQIELDALSGELEYHDAINSLFAQPQTILPPDERVWLTDTELDQTQPANDTLAKRLANTATRALNYLSKTLAVKTVMDQCGTQLKLTPGLTSLLLTRYAIVPVSNAPNKTILEFMTQDFALTSDVVDYSKLPDVFKAWFWTTRVAALWKKWKVTMTDWEHLMALTGVSQLLDLSTLPIDTGLVTSLPIASLERCLLISRLLRVRDTLPETDATLFEVLTKLKAAIPGTIPALSNSTFPADVERVNDAWAAADVTALVDSLDLTNPSDYLQVETWERLNRAFYYLENLNSNADTVKDFAAPAMTAAHARRLKELLRIKFGSETWLTLSAEIQDVLRQRKRDALCAYLLTHPPVGAPTGKWENTNDLYAYYLLDVEMSSCQLTSRLVQASGSVQLFVQRCFMGLEPDVEVKAGGANGDSAWRWWSWMRKFQVWVANRKVFLWPENWIEPELKEDRSQFFKEFENELLQNEINQPNVEAAFTNYLEKLDGVAQLEIAGFYQEDDGDNAIVHVFGRTKGAEPRLYYYRRYDYRQWTPWEKVDLDIHSDYLIPAVVERRLFLFWPVFMEVGDEQENNKRIPIPQSGDTDAEVKQTSKRLKLQMAVSEGRQGKWTPIRISHDFALSDSYVGEITRKHYCFHPVDRSEIDGRFAVRFKGYSVDALGRQQAKLFGAFEIAGCKGVPELGSIPGYFKPAIKPEEWATGRQTSFQKWQELGVAQPRLDAPENDFSIETYDFAPLSTAVLLQTPWLFNMSPAWHMSYFDKLFLDGLVGQELDDSQEHRTPLGSWLPFFYNDKKRTFFVLPLPMQLQLPGGDKRDVRHYYPDLKQTVRAQEDEFEGQVETWLKTIDLRGLSPKQRADLEQFLRLKLAEERNPPYSDELVMQLLRKLVMRFFHWQLGLEAIQRLRLSRFHFKNFYHPFLCDFARMVHNPLEGIPGMMSRATQLLDSGFSFRQSYTPTSRVVSPPTEQFYPQEIVDFTPDGAYSSYNWELFFHAPLLVANALSKNQRFEEARDWYHFIFNPIGVESSVPGGSAMSKYWITKPFFETTDPQYVQQRIDRILGMLAGGPNPDLEDQVRDWRTNPFRPHRIANYRTVAYQKNVVMKYLDNLIAWGDFLFRQDSMESINEATQLYVLTAELLGPRPKKIPPANKIPIESFNELETKFDEFSNALVEVENLVPPLNGSGNAGNSAPLPMLYFCIPHNEKLLGYWDTVADRLFKIRHCMNIEGMVRQLALFEPPIDPAALVKAVAGGADISSALADLNAPLPLYHFNVVLQKANEVCSDVKALGSALLAALEKKDAEALALLRQEQEIRLLDAVRAVREQQVDEATKNLEGIKKSRELAQIKQKFYANREYMNASEKLAAALSGASTAIDAAIAIGYILAGGLKAVPQFIIGAAGFGGSPHATAETGGKTFGSIAEDAALTLSSISNALSKGSSIASTMAGYQRRKDDWDFQKDLAGKEIEQIDKSIAAAELRVAIAKKELDNHFIQIENAEATDAFMRSKYTNLQLYQWQLGQISGVYFQSYKLAFDLAKQAERCFRFELGLQDSSYITFGYWDSLKKGLMSGDKLQHDLRRLETAFLKENRREFELTKNVSLALLDPLALIKLRETGRCFFRIPEEMFDLDYPGHYFRRLKSVGVSLPCLVGPYTTPACTLRLVKSEIRINTDIQSGYGHNSEDGMPVDDTRFVENNIPVKAIAASSAQNDSGLFELNFRDDRYLPFEGAGAISSWSLELFTDTDPDFGRPLRQFDYQTISDVVLHIRYTAREDAGAFKDSAIKNLRTYFSADETTPSLRLLDLRREFPSQWHRFLTSANTTGAQVMEFEMSSNLFQFKDVGNELKINTIWLFARCAQAGTYTATLAAPLTVNSVSLSLAKVEQYGGLHFAQQDTTGLPVEILPNQPPALWQLKITPPASAGSSTVPATPEVEDLVMVLGYEWQ